MFSYSTLALCQSKFPYTLNVYRVCVTYVIIKKVEQSFLMLVSTQMNCIILKVCAKTVISHNTQLYLLNLNVLGKEKKTIREINLSYYQTITYRSNDGRKAGKAQT